MECIVLRRAATLQPAAKLVWTAFCSRQVLELGWTTRSFELYRDTKREEKAQGMGFQGAPSSEALRQKWRDGPFKNTLRPES